LHILVLGAAAGGGFPQWNCNCENCRRCRAGDPHAPAMTQSSLAISGDGERWFLLNASPDLRQQIIANRQLHPRDGLRDSPISGVVLTNGDVDHIAGLLNLRESQPLRLYATRRILDVLAANAVFNVLNPDFVERSTITLGSAAALNHPEGAASGLEIEVFPVPGKVALWLEDPDAGADFGTQAEDTVGLEVRDVSSGTRFYYIPGCARLSPELRERLQGCPLVFFDGTLWQDNEMVDAGLGRKTGQRMGHMSMFGPDGSIAAFEDLAVDRRIFIHINNSNPALLTNSPARQAIEAAGWEVAHDGMEIVL